MWTSKDWMRASTGDGLGLRRRALVVENEQAVRELLRPHLAGFNIDELGEGKPALALARRDRVDLIVLDRMLPDVDGITVCRAIRAQGPNTDTPIVMLVAGGGTLDRTLGLESGADDCLTKPFDTREFRARVRALLRRANPAGSAATRLLRLSAHDLVLDDERRHAIVRGATVHLTAHEFKLLYTLASQPGIVFSRDALVARLGRRERHVTGRTVDTMVRRLRRKIERNAASPEIILTTWGVGYRCADAGT